VSSCRRNDTDSRINHCHQGFDGIKTPTDIFLPCMIATFAATLAAMIIVSLYQKINLFDL
jgi:spore maturation protein SpmA